MTDTYPIARKARGTCDVQRAVMCKEQLLIYNKTHRSSRMDCLVHTIKQPQEIAIAESIGIKQPQEIAIAILLCVAW